MASAEIIATSNDVLGGTPVFAGTRVPVRTLLDYIEAGDTVDEFLLDFPTVSRDRVIQLLELASELLLTPRGRIA